MKNRTARVWRFLSTNLYSGDVPSSHLHSLSCSKSVRPIQWLSLPTICFFIHCWKINHRWCIIISWNRCLVGFPTAPHIYKNRTNYKRRYLSEHVHCYCCVFFFFFYVLVFFCTVLGALTFFPLTNVQVIFQ